MTFRERSIDSSPFLQYPSVILDEHANFGCLDQFIIA